MEYTTKIGTPPTPLTITHQILIGTIWKCVQCEMFEEGPVSLCFKCHSQLPDTHYSPDHSFDEVGPMYAVLERSHSSASSGSNASNNGEGGQEETTTQRGARPRRGARQDSEERRSEREGKVGEADFAAGRESHWVGAEDGDEDDDGGENDDNDDDDDDEEEESLGSAIVHESSDEESWLQ